jgi:Fe2+ or Zn2+ uptake regulation protein
MHTHQREDILNHLLAAERHLTQDEIYSALKSKGIGKVTVFRTLKLLEEAGLTEKSLWF